MYAEHPALTVYLVRLELRQVVRDVVHQAEGAIAENGPEGLASRFADHLAIGTTEIGSRGHGGEVGLPMPGMDRGRGQLTVGYTNAIAGHRLEHLLDVIGADLVPEPARTAVDHHGDVPLSQAELLGDAVVDHPLDLLHLEEVVARAQAPELLPSPLQRPLGDTIQLIHRQCPPVLTVTEVLLRAEAGPHRRPRSLPKNLLQLRSTVERPDTT